MRFFIFLTLLSSPRAVHAQSALGGMFQPAAAGPAESDLNLCLAPRRMPSEGGYVEEQAWNAGAPDFKELPSGDLTDGCDAVVVVTRASTNHYDSRFQWQAISGYTKAVLMSGQANNTWSVNSMLKGILNQVRAQAQPGTQFHAAALAQKEKARAAAAPPPAAAPGFSQAQMEEMAKAAVEKANAANAAKAPAPEAPAELHSDVDTPKYKGETHPHDIAIVVGVEKYVDLPEARFAERDAQAVRSHLVALGVPERNAVLLTGERASRASLVKNLDTWLAQNAKADSTVYFYYSGHGAPDAKTGEAYLVPRDGDPAFLEDTGYPLKRLYAKLGALKTKRVIVMLDACFSGAGGRSVLPKGARPLVTKIDTGSVAGNVVALTASAASEISGTEEAQGHGLFTYFFLRGLAGAAKDSSGAVTVKSLYEYLTPNVEDEARRQNRVQTPQLLGEAALTRLR